MHEQSVGPVSLLASPSITLRMYPVKHILLPCCEIFYWTNSGMLWKEKVSFEVCWPNLMLPKAPWCLVSLTLWLLRFAQMALASRQLLLRLRAASFSNGQRLKTLLLAVPRLSLAGGDICGIFQKQMLETQVTPSPLSICLISWGFIRIGLISDALCALLLSCFFKIHVWNQLCYLECGKERN